MLQNDIFVIELRVSFGTFVFYFRFINSHNRKHVSFQVAVNHLADRSPKELGILRGRTYSYGYNGGLPFHPDLSTLKDVPDTLDWRLYGNSNMHASLILDGPSAARSLKKTRTYIFPLRD